DRPDGVRTPHPARTGGCRRSSRSHRSSRNRRSRWRRSRWRRERGWCRRRRAGCGRGGFRGRRRQPRAEERVGPVRRTPLGADGVVERGRCGRAVTRPDAVRAVPVADVMALTPLQRGLYSMTVLSESEYADGDPYVIAMAADVTGSLDVPLRERCAAAMLDRHPNLRVSFVHGDLPHPVQIVPSRVTLPWRHVRVRSAAEAAELEQRERRRPFDLERGPVIRFLLIEVPGPRWRLVIVAHHIVIAGWPLPLFVSELLTLYRAGGEPQALGTPPRPYRDYIGWLANRDQDAGRALWSEHLAGLDGPTLLTPALSDAEPAPGLP